MKTKRANLIQQAAGHLKISATALEKCATDPKYTGVLKILFDDSLWSGVVQVSKGTDLRKGKSTATLWSLLHLNYQYLPLGNAYGERLVKLIKNARCQDVRSPVTISRKIAARSASHIWKMEMVDFQKARHELSHNVKPTKVGNKRKAGFPQLAIDSWPLRAR